MSEDMRVVTVTCNVSVTVNIKDVPEGWDESNMVQHIENELSDGRAGFMPNQPFTVDSANVSELKVQTDELEEADWSSY